MARIPLVDPSGEEVPPDARRFLEEIAASRGRVANFQRALANDPELARGFLGWTSVARRGAAIPLELYELAYLAASTVNGCYY
jgi:alkylhydroperoxidase family enzyme